MFEQLATCGGVGGEQEPVQAPGQALRQYVPRSKGILMSEPMVLAILREAGAKPPPKTVTRRVSKVQPGPGYEFRPLSSRITPGPGGEKQAHVNMWLPYPVQDSIPESSAKALVCPYGEVGDTLWVRETFYAWGYWKRRYNIGAKRHEWAFVDETLDHHKAYRYLAGERPGWYSPVKRVESDECRWWRRPALFMPKEASRICLEITGVTLELLHDINEAEAIREGLGVLPVGSYVAAYRELWESLNGLGSWDKNPLCWAVSFQKIV